MNDPNAVARPGHRHPTKDDWTRMRSRAEELYKVQKKKINDVVQVLEEENELRITERMFRQRAKEWNILKHRKEHEMKAVLRKLREGKRERGCTPTLKFKDETITEAEVWQHFRKKRPKGSSLADVPTPTRSRAPTPPGLLESEAVSFPSGPSLGGSPNDESSISSYSPCVVTESSSQTYQKDGADTLTSPQRSESGNNVIQRRTLFSITGLQLQAITRPMSFKIRDVKFESTMMLTPFKIRDDMENLPCSSLRVGTWYQSGLTASIFYSFVRASFTYCIEEPGGSFKIEYPFSSVKSLTLDTGDARGASEISSKLIVELAKSPSFSQMEQFGSHFIQCHDLTKDQQASQVLVHHLRIPSTSPRDSFAKFAFILATVEHGQVIESLLKILALSYRVRWMARYGLDLSAMTRDLVAILWELESIKDQRRSLRVSCKNDFDSIQCPECCLSAETLDSTALSYNGWTGDGVLDYPSVINNSAKKVFGTSSSITSLISALVPHKDLIYWLRCREMPGFGFLCQACKIYRVRKAHIIFNLLKHEEDRLDMIHLQRDENGLIGAMGSTEEMNDPFARDEHRRDVEAMWREVDELRCKTENFQNSMRILMLWDSWHWYRAQKRYRGMIFGFSTREFG